MKERSNYRPMASDDIPFSLGNLSETFSHCYYHQLLKEKEKFGPEGLIKTTEEVYALANDGKQMKVIDTLTAKVFKTEAIEIPDEQQQSIAAPEPAKKSKQGKVADIIDVSNVRPGPANPKIQWTLVVPEFGPDGKKLNSNQRKKLRKKILKERKEQLAKMAAERKKELDEMGVDPNVLAEEHQKKVRLPQFYKFPRWSVMNEAEHKKYLAALLHQQMKGEFKFKENKTWIEELNKQLGAEQEAFNKFVKEFAVRNHFGIYKIPPNVVTFVVRHLHMKFDAVRSHFPPNFVNRKKLSMKTVEQQVKAPLESTSGASDLVSLIVSKQPLPIEEEIMEDVEFSFIQALLEVGRPPKIFLPNMFNKVKLIAPTTKSVSKASVTEDNNFIRLAEKWGPTVLIPFSSLKQLLFALGFDNDDVNFDIPFTMKPVKVIDQNRMENVLIFEKPIETNRWNNPRKQFLYMKHCVKATLVPPTVDAKAARKLRQLKVAGDSQPSTSEHNFSPKTPEMNEREQLNASGEDDIFDIYSVDQVETFGTIASSKSATLEKNFNTDESDQEGLIISMETDLPSGSQTEESPQRSRLRSKAGSSSPGPNNLKSLVGDAIWDSPSQRTRSKKRHVSDSSSDAEGTKSFKIVCDEEREVKKAKEALQSATSSHVYQPPPLSRPNLNDSEDSTKLVSLDFISELKRKQHQSAYGMRWLADERREINKKKHNEPLENEVSTVGKQICYDLWLINDYSLIVRYNPDGIYHDTSAQIGTKQRATISPYVEYLFQFGGTTAADAEVFSDYLTSVLKRSEVHFRARVNPFVRELLAIEALSIDRLQTNRIKQMFNSAIKKLHQLLDTIINQNLTPGNYLMRFNKMEVNLLSQCEPGVKDVFNLHEYCEEAKISCSQRIETPPLEELWTPIDPKVVLNWHKVKGWVPGCFPPRIDGALTEASKAINKKLQKARKKRVKYPAPT